MFKTSEAGRHGFQTPISVLFQASYFVHAQAFMHGSFELIYLQEEHCVSFTNMYATSLCDVLVFVCYIVTGHHPTMLLLKRKQGS